MDVQKKPTLAEKQEFWTEQLPNFEAAYWLPSHFEFVVFYMDQGNYVIKEGLDPDFKDDATEIWHRVNTGWTMWKKAINFSRKKAKAVPECKWTQNEDGYFDASCGQSFVFSEPEDKPSSHEFTHCCFCGGKLVEEQELAND